MKRITKKIVCLLTVATMLLVATVTVVGAVSTPDTVVDGQEYPFKSYCINKTTGDLKNTEMVYSNEHYDTVTAVYNNLTAGTYEFGATGSPYFNEPATTEVKLTKDGSVRIYYYYVTNDIEAVVYDEPLAPDEKYEALITTDDGDFVQGILLSTSSERYDCITGVADNLKAGTYNVNVRNGNDFLVDKDFTLSKDGSVRINYYTVTNEVDVIVYESEKAPYEVPSGYLMKDDTIVDMFYFQPATHGGVYTHTSENLSVGTYTIVILTGKGTEIEKSFTTTIKSDVLLTYVQDSDEFTFVELGTITPESKDNTNPTASTDVSSSTSDVVLKDSTNSNNDNGVVKTGDSPVVSIVFLSALTLAAAGMFFAKRKFDF